MEGVLLHADANAFGFREVLTPDVVASMPIADDLAMSQVSI